MSKICDRNYSGNTMLSVKMEGNIGLCPSCNQPADCHGKSPTYRALFWALHFHTGMSSESIAQHMATGISDGRPPSDSDDRSRCIQLLELVPEWLPRLDELKQYDTAEEKPTGLVINSSGIHADTNTWARQIPLIAKEGNFYAKD